MSTNVSLSDNSLEEEWLALLGRARPNVLFIGPKASVRIAIARHLSCLHAPLVQWHPRSALEPASQSKGTLLIWDIDALDVGQQQQLITWLDRHENVQLISVAEHPVFPLVLRQEFLDRLYYRLNVVCVELAEMAVTLRAH
jgi:hypothetical protein